MRWQAVLDRACCCDSFIIVHVSSRSQLTSIAVGLEPIADSSGPPAVPSRIPKMSFGVSSTLHSQKLQCPEMFDELSQTHGTTLSSFKAS